MAFKKTLESLLDCKEIKPVNRKGNQSWIFLGRSDVEATLFWPPDVKKWLIGRDPDARKHWRQEEKGLTEDKMVGWHHWLDGHEFAQAPEAGDGQGSQACSSPWGRKESDTVRLNWTEKVRYSWFTILVLGVQHSDLKIFIGYIPFIVIKCWLFPWVNWFFKQFIFYFWLCWAFVATWAFL